MQTVTLAPIQYPLVNRFYRQQSYPAKAGRRDRVWVITDQERIVAALTSVYKGEALYLLRGLLVAPPYRGRGLAEALLCECRYQLSLDHCYGFIEPGLQTLYQRAGFYHIDPENLPGEYLQGAYQRYCQHKSLLVVSNRR